jgi:prepilin-type N-terminal cleavage/methylation domain-containing protein/prepilin-type processing-associated H-X9-DG protein
MNRHSQIAIYQCRRLPLKNPWFIVSRPLPRKPGQISVNFKCQISNVELIRSIQHSPFVIRDSSLPITWTSGKNALQWPSNGLLFVFARRNNTCMKPAQFSAANSVNECRSSSISENARGFTLVELLVVIATVAALALTLLPVLAKGRAEPQGTQCINNMRQLAKSWLMYVDDNNGCLPLNTIGGGNSWVTNSAANVLFDGIRGGSLYQYNQNVKIYMCPGFIQRTVAVSGSQVLQARQEYGNPNIVAGTLEPLNRTCSINYPLGGGPVGQNGILATGVRALVKYTDIKPPNPNPAQMFVFCDENEYSVDDGVFAMYPAGSGENIWWNMPGSRHQRGTTWSFADGHCEYWKWHGTVVPAAEYNPSYQTYYSPAYDNSDDLARVQACTCPLGN